MRYKIWEQDDYFEVPTKDGGKTLFMDPSLVVLPEKASLAWSYQHYNPPIGWVTDIRLEEGEISGEVEWTNKFNLNDETFDPKHFRLGGYYMQVEKSEDGTQVTYAELKAVSVVLLSGVPGFPKDVLL